MNPDENLLTYVDRVNKEMSLVDPAAKHISFEVARDMQPQLRINHLTEEQYKSVIRLVKGFDPTIYKPTPGL